MTVRAWFRLSRQHPDAVSFAADVAAFLAGRSPFVRRGTAVLIYNEDEYKRWCARERLRDRIAATWGL